MIVTQLLVGSMQNFSYVIGDSEGGNGAVIDPSAEYELIAAEAAKRRLTLTHVFNTHSHYDHTGGNDFFRKRGAKLVGYKSAPTRPDIAVDHGDVVKVDGLEVGVLYTPGHIQDAVCFVAGGYLFTGDTLFIGECGRVDLPGSDVQAMHHSLLTVIRGLADDLMVMPGHNYGPAPQRTLGEEKRLNYTLKPRTLDEFRRFMVAS
jgi:hydroxyacylglutathione hydrolase